MPFRNLQRKPLRRDVSGHAVSAGAAASVLAETLGTDRVSFTITNPEVGITRSYSAFSELANEAREVRIWSGVHFRASQTAGLQTGQRIGRAVIASRLLALNAKNDQPAARR